ncbi:MAG: AAA family ATPase [Spirochaetota bacterium]|nr:AAA family ATPase [Spirochaetota bacterium]
MIEISGFSFNEEISKGYHSVLYRGCDDHSVPVLIKVYTIKDTSYSKIAQFKKEFHNIYNLKSEGIAKAKDVEFCGSDIAIVQEDFNGIFLNDFINNGYCEIQKFIDISIQLATSVGDMHNIGISHKELKPKSILINQASGGVKIIDYGLSSILTGEYEQIYIPEILSNSLTYISPEQTGRMNRIVDYRTDFYSLGIIFYELLTGTIPFSSNNPLELFHSHIAKIPKTPMQHRADIPEVISGIIMKLLSKNPEDRYQSAYGLISDLEECKAQIEDKGRIDTFDIGKYDVSEKLIIPQKLYGRDHEIDKLISSFNRICTGISELTLVTGYAGIGKSVLVKELQKPIIERRGYFLFGKYDQLRMDKPLSGIIQAFRELIHQLLSESEDQIIKWKKLLLDALGNNGKIITDVIPEVELLIGTQPDIPDIGIEEAQGRFNYVFQDFVRVFPKADHPVVIFLDDLQWVDSASLDIIKILIFDSSIRYVFFVGAFRDNEVTPSHRLKLWFDEIEKEGIEYNQIFLLPLSLESINLLIADTLKHSPYTTESLSELIYQKTGGNPFFIKQFLKILYDEEMLIFCTSKGWQWDIDSIIEMEATDNVINLMTKKILRLPEGPLDLIKTASCFGNIFLLEELAELYGNSIDEVYADLLVLLESGFIILIQGGYKFTHDRIWEAAYTLITEEERKKLHYKIGKMLLQKTGVDEISEKPFDIADQLNLGMELITDKKERVEIARLNFSAGQKAKASSAYKAADQYLKIGMDLLPQDAWEKEYDLTLALYTGICEVKYLIGDTNNAEIFFHTVLKNAKRLLDKVRVYEIKMTSFTILNRRGEALSTGREALSMMGVDMPKEANPQLIMEEMNLVKQNIVDREIEELANLPVLSDLNKLAIARILISSITASYTTAPEYFTLIVLKLVNLSLKYGNSNYSPFAYVVYGVLLCGRLGEIEPGYRFGRLALALVDRFNAVELKAKVYYIFGDMINHWNNHYREDLPYLLKSYRSGSETGDISFASYAVNHFMITSFLMGEPLGELREMIDNYFDVILKYQQLSVIQEYKLWYQMVTNLLEMGEDKLLIKGEICDEKEIVQEWESTNMLTGIGYYTVAKQIILYLYGDYKNSITISKKGERCIDTMTGMNLIAEYYYYYSLSLLAYYPNASSDEQVNYLKRAEVNQEKMKKWVAHAPENFEHKYLLVEAEVSKLQGEIKSAINLYDRAIELAGQNGFIQDEAIANERAALFYLSEDMEKIARIYMQDAYNGYIRWGAVVKADDIEDEYPYLLGETGIKGDVVVIEKLSQKHSLKDTSTMLDYTSIVNSLQVISSEIVLENLLDKLMKIVVESSGATRGLCILIKDGNLFIEAERVLSDEEATIVKSIPVDDRDDLLMPVINYVKRSLRFVVLDDAVNNGDYKFDPYIISSKQRSIFCLPIIRQTKQVGILYLENSIAANAFTQDRVEVLRLLAAQAAISLENAKLIDDIKKADELLRESELRYRILFESAPMGIGLSTFDGRVIACNDALSRMIGSTEKELIQSDLKSFYKYPEDRKQLVSQLDTDGLVRSFETTLIRKDGSTFEAKFNTTPLILSNENVLLTVFEDITEQKKAEIALKASEERYRSMFNNNHSVMLMIDPDSSEIVDANPAACAFYGYSFEKLTSMKINEINILTVDKVFLEMESAKSGEKEQFIFRHRLANGEERDVEVYSGIIDYFGRELLYSIIHDISARKQAEGELARYRDHLEDLVKERTKELKDTQEKLIAGERLSVLGQVAGSISHELRNPLGVIDSSVYFLHNRLDNSDPKVVQHLYRIKSHIKRATDIIESLLNLTRMKEPQKERLDFVKVLSEAIITSKIPPSVKIVRDIPEEKIMISGDREQISIVFLNIIKNAVDAIEGEGIITIRTRIAEGGEFTEVTFKDTGSGITEEELKKIFQPLYSTKSSGIGFGLSISQQIVEKHGGKIYAVSDPGTGASFVVRFPLVN